MAQERYLADVLQELRDAKKTGALFINVQESSEDLMRMYLKNGDLYYLTYGSAIGDDVMEIIEFYTLRNATFFDGVAAPAGSVPVNFPMKKFIATLRNAFKKVRVP